MNFQRLSGMASALAAGFVISAAVHAEAFVTPLVGGSGGSSYTRSCGVSAVLVGIQVRFGSWIDQLTPVCRPIAANGALGNAFTLARIGGTGGINIEQANCPTGKVVAGVVARWASFIDSVELRCATWDAASKTRSSSTTSGGTAGAGGGVTTTSLSCPAGQVAKAFKGKAGSFVDSLSVVCNAWNQ